MSELPTLDSPFVLGMRNLHQHPRLASPEAFASWLEARVDEGLHWFDHADIYGEGDENGGTERHFGAALSLRPGLRDKVRIITKTCIVPAARDRSPFQVKHYDSSPGYLARAIDSALQRLGVERLDHLLLHRPDPLLDAEPTARALEAAIDAGKIGAVGVSNHLPAQWRRLQAVLERPLSINQFELSIARSEALFDGRWDASSQDGMLALAYSPLCGGRLFEGVLVNQMLRQLSEQSGVSAAGVALAWLKRIPNGPVPVIGTLRPNRIQALLEDTRSDFELERTAWFALLESARAHRVL
ncbi:aldo/keto reductase [Halotalea alkalilenta]|uniref:aldo/keto reductase n=1 Tax=Halotalea alkalilenta TaxID=376489 RepID=UPI0004841A54|nr:aldo/keto reductase [Halotalea alkalilenta]